MAILLALNNFLLRNVLGTNPEARCLVINGMQAIILAAGEGKRLRPFTDHLPKPMVDVQGKPILEHVISALPAHVTDVVIVTGYKEEVVMEYFGDSFSGKSITYVKGVKPKGTGYALQKARPFLTSEYFLLLNGDDLYHPDDLAVSALRRPTVFVTSSQNPERFGVCLINEQGLLARIIEKPKEPPSNLVNTGGYVLNHEIFDVPVSVLPNGELNLAEQIGNWAMRRPVHTHKATFWNPINTIEELEEARRANLKAINHNTF